MTATDASPLTRQPTADDPSSATGSRPGTLLTLLTAGSVGLFAAVWATFALVPDPSATVRVALLALGASSLWTLAAGVVALWRTHLRGDGFVGAVGAAVTTLGVACGALGVTVVALVSASPPQGMFVFPVLAVGVGIVAALAGSLPLGIALWRDGDASRFGAALLAGSLPFGLGAAGVLTLLYGGGGFVGLLAGVLAFALGIVVLGLVR
ncbi:hypothetical protein [Halobium salinum]|uniref:hypothetical protein n=1 Tax=Halobium salinum TaxID=1364940 RepID=UPI002271E832|nr:hypothetical protein [Halobium salinum]